LTDGSFSVPGRVVILSPHCDDAVWSLGGAMAEWSRGTEVVVVSVFDGEPPAEAHAIHAEAGHAWRGMNGAPLRCREDAAALDMLGCTRIGLQWPEAAFRCEPGSRFECESLASVFVGPDPDRWPMPRAEWTARLEQQLRPDDTLLVPLAVGGHVDHCLVHCSAQALPMVRYYYAEFPYLDAGRPDQLSDHAARLKLALQPVEVSCDWRLWEQASLRYRSQVLRMFGSAARFSEALAAYGSAEGSQARCRIWSTREM